MKSRRPSWVLAGIGAKLLVFVGVRPVSAQDQIDLAVPIGGAPQWAIDLDVDEPGIQVCRVIEKGPLPVDVYAYNISALPQPIRAVHFWIHYDQTILTCLGVDPSEPPLNGFPTASPLVCNPGDPLCGPMPNATRVVLVILTPPCPCGPIGPGPSGTIFICRLLFDAYADGQTGVVIGPGFAAPPPSMNTTTLYRYPTAPEDPCPCGGTFVPIAPPATVAFAKTRIVVDSTDTLTCLNVNRTSDAAALNLPLNNPDTSLDSPPLLHLDWVTLRSALQLANQLPGDNRITFRLPGALTISPLSPLPALSDSSGGTEIDGTVQAGVVVSGAAAASALFGTVNGFTLTTADNAVRDLTINGFSGTGVVITGSAATGNLLTGNHIGTNAAGTAAVANDVGVVVTSSATGNIIGGAAAADRNVISGNESGGIRLLVGAGTNEVLGNYIGLDAAGAAALANGGEGIRIDTADNQIGGAAAGEGNVISGNDFEGILITGTSATDNVVRGNRIGTNAAGAAAIPNGVGGIHIDDAPDTIIGGPGATDGNVVSGNDYNGITIAGAGALDTLVQRNRIGTDAAGSADLGNESHGVFIQNASLARVLDNLASGNGLSGVAIVGTAANNNLVQDNFLGTDVAGATAIQNDSSGVFLNAPLNEVRNNVASGNQFNGIEIFGDIATNNIVQENTIGLDVAGAFAISNGANGVVIGDGASDNSIGGLDSSVGNTISGNVEIGVWIRDSLDNLVQGNVIGLDVPALVARGNDRGVVVETTAAGPAPAALNIIGADTGDPESAGNRIAGNVLDGVELTGVGTDFNIVARNVIGVNAAGGDAGNGASGVNINGGASTNGIRDNVIAANGITSPVLDGDGVRITGSDENVVFANTIGLPDLPNVENGVFINESNDTQVLNNFIRDNGGNGVRIFGTGPADLSTGNLVRGNFLELNQLSGVLLDADVVANIIEGNEINENGADGVMVLGSPLNDIRENTISLNVNNGVRVAGTSIHIEENSIFDNELLGIDLVPGDGVTPNDPGDPDGGGNMHQNFPVLDGAGPVEPATLLGGTLVSGSLNSTPSRTFTIEVFANDECDPSDHGEGETFIGSADVTTNASGDVDFDITVGALPGGALYLTATATDVVLQNTSEFSQCLALGGGCPDLCDGDIDGNGNVGFNDLTLLLIAWGPCTPCCPEDIDGNGDVGFNDLTLLLIAWGDCE